MGETIIGNLNECAKQWYVRGTAHSYCGCKNLMVEGGGVNGLAEGWNRRFLGVGPELFTCSRILAKSSHSFFAYSLLDIFELWCTNPKTKSHAVHILRLLLFHLCRLYTIIIFKHNVYIICMPFVL